MRQLKSVFFLLAFGVISVLAVLAQDSPLPMPTAAPSPEVTEPPEPPTLEVTLTPRLTPTASSTIEVVTPTAVPNMTLRLLSPEPKATVSGDGFVFSWTEVAGTVGYRLVIQKLDGTRVFRQRFDPMTICISGVCTVSGSGLGITAGRYRWRVVLIPAKGEPIASKWRRVTVDSHLNIVHLKMPPQQEHSKSRATHSLYFAEYFRDAPPLQYWERLPSTTTTGVPTQPLVNRARLNGTSAGVYGQISITADLILDPDTTAVYSISFLTTGLEIKASQPKATDTYTVIFEVFNSNDGLIYQSPTCTWTYANWFDQENGAKKCNQIGFLAIEGAKKVKVIFRTVGEVLVKGPNSFYSLTLDGMPTVPNNVIIHVGTTTIVSDATATPTFTPTPSPTPPYCDELTPTATWEMPTQEPIGTPVVIVNPTRCPDTCIDPPFPTTVAMSAPQSLNSNYCQIRPTSTPSATPTPGYKVNIISINPTERAWSSAETTAIDIAIEQVGRAFDSVATTTNNAITGFNLAMMENSGTEILFVRTEQSGMATVTVSDYEYQYGSQAGQTATFQYPNVQEGYCITYQEGIIAENVLRPAAVLCNGDLIDHYNGTILTLEASEYTFVHELGHLFDYRTSYPDPNDPTKRLGGLSGPITTNFQLEDCALPPNTGVVMGDFYTGWTRGRRGWGTGPQQYYDNALVARPLVTDFQQNTANIPIEAAADSFLNWVYRFNTSGGAPTNDPCAPTPTPLAPYDDWPGPGFLNMAWSGTPHPIFIPDSNGIPGTPDPSLPGDSRYFDIDVRIRQIFSSHNW